MENFKESEKEGKGKLSKSQSPKSTEISKGNNTKRRSKELTRVF